MKTKSQNDIILKDAIAKQGQIVYSSDEIEKKKTDKTKEAKNRRDVAKERSKYGSLFTKIPPQRQINKCVSDNIC